jgi:hypothetical protein
MAASNIEMNLFIKINIENQIMHACYLLKNYKPHLSIITKKEQKNKTN